MKVVTDIQQEYICHGISFKPKQIMREYHVTYDSYVDAWQHPTLAMCVTFAFDHCQALGMKS